ncbi:MAG TPA: arsinothricin resistance N-acetyltransferase ArsN1 family A [Thermoanaerobaculia bacterium]|nr:arsinothricin resistance N-acetyltransferase ArsN1 family A [Thermoanaerobaculia bacterium]
MSPVIRAAAPADAAAICEIFIEGIVDRVATLETELRTPAEREEWLRARSPRHPVLVAELNGEVVAWASLNPFNARRAYDHVADFSIYVARRMRGHRLGERMIAHLLDEARGLGYHKLVLAAFPFNEAGMRLYRRCGFREVGVYREQGMLDGRWVDVVIMERLL